MNSGFTDKPTSTVFEDAFGVRQYINGLNEFITECCTPMTIAIQGDWGSGKTSMMNMIREQLADRVITTWFNTWQFSQFNMGDALSISFLSRLIADLEAGQTQKNARIKKAIKTISRFAKAAGVIATDAFFSGKAADMVENGLSSSSEEECDMPQAISELKEQFQLAVKTKIEQAGKDRLVIFIDDLDRLNPGKAVELLEVLKLFLDCDNCVFVLAIDYEVVSQGVKQKYGELLGEEKGRSFFDKIIQVPFKMPVAQYDVKNYVLSSLQALGIEVADGEVASYVNLIQHSVGCNPRAMKRLFNAFLLLNKIATNGTVTNGFQRKLLFAVLCLQLSFEPVYNHIVQCADVYCELSLLYALTASENYNDAFDLQLSDEEIARATAFMQAFIDVIDQDGNEELSEEEQEAFINILRFSTITSSSSSATETDSKLESSYRYYNRDLVKEILVALQGTFTDGALKLYQTRTNNNAEWKKYYAGGWRRFGATNFEFKIATNLQIEESTLSVKIYPADKNDFSYFEDNPKLCRILELHRFARYETYYQLCEKTCPADAREEIVGYFRSILPAMLADLENFFK